LCVFVFSRCRCCNYGLFRNSNATSMSLQNLLRRHCALYQIDPMYRRIRYSCHAGTALIISVKLPLWNQNCTRADPGVVTSRADGWRLLTRVRRCAAAEVGFAQKFCRDGDVDSSLKRVGCRRSGPMEPAARLRWPGHPEPRVEIRLNVDIARRASWACSGTEHFCANSAFSARARRSEIPRPRQITSRCRSSLQHHCIGI
jgi:hypothetical protein